MVLLSITIGKPRGFGSPSADPITDHIRERVWHSYLGHAFFLEPGVGVEAWCLRRSLIAIVEHLLQLMSIHK